MLKHVFATAVLVIALKGSAGIAQPVAGPSGHWEGTLQAPGQEIKIEVDLALAPGGNTWEGTINIPVQGLKGFPLAAITVQGDTVTFAMDNVPGDPRFTGRLSKDAKSLAGELRQGGGTIPFALTRTGEAKIERPPDSTPVTKELEGSWEGTLDVDGKMLRLGLKLANQPGGPATGTLISVDQGGVEIPIAAVVQSGTHLKLVLPSIVGNYDGDLTDGQLTGTWTQGPRTWTLVFKRPK